MPLRFLSLAEALAMHQDQIVRYGGEAGVRELDLLKSALAMPAATCGGVFLHTDLFEMAAAYLFHLVQHHPFVEDNKRVGAVSAVVFLALNGYDFDAPTGALHDFVLALASGEKTKAESALFLRKHSHPNES